MEKINQVMIETLKNACVTQFQQPEGDTLKLISPDLSVLTAFSKVISEIRLPIDNLHELGKKLSVLNFPENIKSELQASVRDVSLRTGRDYGAINFTMPSNFEPRQREIHLKPEGKDLVARL